MYLGANKLLKWTFNYLSFLCVCIYIYASVLSIVFFLFFLSQNPLKHLIANLTELFLVQSSTRFIVIVFNNNQSTCFCSTQMKVTKKSFEFFSSLCDCCLGLTSSFIICKHLGQNRKKILKTFIWKSKNTLHIAYVFNWSEKNSHHDSKMLTIV